MQVLVALSLAQGVFSSPIPLESKAEVVSSSAVKVARHFPKTDSCPPFSSCLDVTAKDQTEAAPRHGDTGDEVKIEAGTETDQATVLSAEKPRGLFDFPGPKCSETVWC